MKTRTKAALTVLCALLLVVATFLGTLAYLTSITGEVKNTFTVGKVTITLDEAKTDVYGVADSEAERVSGNELKLIPGHEYTKDPTIHVAAGSESCWIFVQISDDIDGLQDATTVAEQIKNNGWTELEGETGVYYREHTAADGTDDGTEYDAADYKVFSTLKIKTDAELSWVNEDTELSVTGYAIQKDSLTNAADAWEALGVNAGGYQQGEPDPEDTQTPEIPEQVK